MPDLLLAQPRVLLTWHRSRLLKLPRVPHQQLLKAGGRFSVLPGALVSWHLVDSALQLME